MRNAPIWLEHMYSASVCETRDRQAGDGSKSLLVVEWACG
ncbi:hypothetical protein AKJ09_04780 [Labilithrix luteola]|uniref:Uncharacterized protein n=1 Tax=Labilithrix luteola TaxID=1391654 RepID=A0A0K1PXJ0_9BACT|nr:hypothetical protein AKJ09_04780 [Labilithrix luteola]